MKRFYRCKICGSEFCLKGKKYCEEGGDIFCSGQRNMGHTETAMEFAGNNIEDLRNLRKKHKQG